jgi:hypothetical protein
MTETDDEAWFTRGVRVALGRKSKVRSRKLREKERVVHTNRAYSQTPSEITTAFTNCGTGASVQEGSETNAWGTTTRLTAKDSVRSPQSPSTDPAVNQWAQGTNYGFSIPAGSTILGVQLLVNRLQASGTSGYITDDTVQLIYNNARIGDNKAKAGNWTGSGVDVTYGATNDVWGTTLTVEMVNSSTFGVRFRCKRTAGDRGANLDCLQLAITYQ